MKKSIASIILNWIGGGKTPIPVRFLKSIDIPGNTPNSGNDMHILKITTGNLETDSLEELQSVMTFDDVPITKEDALKITPLNTIVRYGNIDMAITTMKYPRVEHDNEIDIYGGFRSLGDNSFEVLTEISIDLVFQLDSYRIHYKEL